MDSFEFYQIMTSGRLFCYNDPSIAQEQLKRLDLVFAYNQLKPSQQQQKQEMLKAMFAEIGEDCYLETPFYSEWAGKFCRFGKGIYANYNFMLVDDGEITVGDYTMFGPNVTLCTATHPISPTWRLHHAQYNPSIHIGRNVWIGASCIVLPGVTIGDNTVIGAGSLVTKDIPANVVAYGSPCKVVRPITEEDEKFYRPGCPIDLTLPEEPIES